jgi:hypothetical protein
MPAFKDSMYEYEQIEKLWDSILLDYPIALSVLAVDVTM